jgi:hypothetical protein
MAKKTSKGSEAAKKAWETRRKNARRLDYQERARKAWETRRKTTG